MDAMRTAIEYVSTRIRMREGLKSLKHRSRIKIETFLPAGRIEQT